MDQFIDDEEEETCPLCVEEFDLSDKNFRPCPCGYQICQFCYNNIRTTLNGLCPACRRPYDDKSIEWKSISPEELASYRADQALQAKRKAAARQKEALKKEAETQNRKHLAGLRVVQKNLVYVTGMTPNTREPKLLDILRTNDYFGQYGEIVKIVVSKPRDASGPHPQSVGVYVTYRNKEDAATCISCVNGSRNGDRVLKAQYGTTKYCSAYLRNETCSNRNCMFLHEAGDENETFTRRDMSSMNAANNQHVSAPTAGHTSAPPTSAPAAENPPLPSASHPSPSDRNALPSSASWGDKAAPPSGTGQEGTEAESPLAEATEPEHSVHTLSPAIESEPLPVTEPPSEQSLENSEASLYNELAKIVCRNLHFAFQPPASLSQEELQVMKIMPPFWDWRTSARRHALHEKRVRDVHGSSASQPPNTEGGSLQLGGEPEDPSEAPSESVLVQPGARMPGLGTTNMRNELTNAVQGLGPHPGSLAQQSMKQDSSQATALAHALMTAQAQGISNEQFRAAARGMENNKLSGSKFVGQIPMIPQSDNLGRPHPLSAPVTQYYNPGVGVQGPPPGLKSTGTPPAVSNSNLYPQSQTYIPTGLNYNAGPNVRNSNEEVVRELLRSQRPPTGSSQMPDTGKRESLFPSFLHQSQLAAPSHPTNVPGTLNFSYDSQPAHFPETGPQKQKKRGKKHKHANTSSGGGGVADVTDPSLLQARLHHAGAFTGQGVYGQGADSGLHFGKPDLGSPASRLSAFIPPPGLENASTPLARSPLVSRPASPRPPVAAKVDRWANANIRADKPGTVSSSAVQSPKHVFPPIQTTGTSTPSSQSAAPFANAHPNSKIWPPTQTKGDQETPKSTPDKASGPLSQAAKSSSLTETPPLAPPPSADPTPSRPPSPTPNAPTSVPVKAGSRKQRIVLVSTATRPTLTSSSSTPARGSPMVAKPKPISPPQVLSPEGGGSGVKPGERNSGGDPAEAANDCKDLQSAALGKEEPKQEVKSATPTGTKEPAETTAKGEIYGGDKDTGKVGSRDGPSGPKTASPSIPLTRPVSPTRRPAHRTIRVVKSLVPKEEVSLPPAATTPASSVAKAATGSVPQSRKGSVSSQSFKLNSEPKNGGPSTNSRSSTPGKKSQVSVKNGKSESGEKNESKAPTSSTKAHLPSAASAASPAPSPVPTPAPVQTVIQEPIVGRMKKAKKPKPPKPPKVAKPAPVPATIEPEAAVSAEAVPEEKIEPLSAAESSVEKPQSKPEGVEVSEADLPTEDQAPVQEKQEEPSVTIRERLEAVANSAGLPLESLAALKADQRIYLSPPGEDRFRLADLNSELLRGPALNPDGSIGSEPSDGALHFGGQDGHSWTRAMITPEGDHLRALTPAEEQRYLQVEKALKEQKARASVLLMQAQAEGATDMTANPNYYDHFHSSISEKRNRQIQEFIAGTAPITFPTNGLRTSLRATSRGSNGVNISLNGGADGDIYIPHGGPNSLDSSAIFDLPVPLHPLVAFQIEGLDQGGGCIGDHLNRFIVPAEPDVPTDETLALRKRCARRLDTTLWAARENTSLNDLGSHDREKVALDMLLQGFIPSFRSIDEIDSLATLSTQATLDIEKRVTSLAQELRHAVGLNQAQ